MAFKGATVNGTGNSESLYLGARYAEILDFLCSPVTGPANVKLLVSEPGLGKTVMLRSAIERMKAEAKTAFVFWTLFKPKDFVTHLLVELGSKEPPPSDLNAARGQFGNLLRRAAADGRRVVLAIDDAHNLSPFAFRNLSALLDCDTARPPQITVLLAGLPGLPDQLDAPQATGIRERIAGVKTITPLNAEQTAEYIGARMTALGVGRVSPEQLAHIAASSGGVLRTIDKLCQQFLPQNGIGQRRGNGALRPDTPAKESSITTEAHVSRIAAWVTGHPGTWAGTVTELAAATGISANEISDAVENRSQELRRVGIAAASQRSPGRLKMITLSRVELEATPESHVALPELHVGIPESHVAIPESHVASPELHEDNASPQPNETRKAPENEPALDHETMGNVWLYPPIENPSAAKRWLTWALRIAVVLAVILGIAAGLRYLRFSSSGYQASSVSRVSEPKRSSAGDEVTGLQKRAEAGDIGAQTALADRYRDGNGVPRDDKAAMALYERAAIKGDPVAQHRLGLALSSEKGGMGADRVAAYAWLVMARNGGQIIDQATLDSLTRSLTPTEILDVRYRLGLMYKDGIGCVPDLVFADEWFLLGSAGGDARSRAQSTALEQRMSPGQISQAHARSDDWLRRHAINLASNAAAR